MALQQVNVPDIGDFKDVDIIDVMVNVGDSINVEQPLIMLESDKASMEVPSTTAGVVKELLVKVGDKVSEGSGILMVETTATASAAGAPEIIATSPSPTSAAPVTPAPEAASATATMVVPDIGDFKNVDIIEVMVKVGDYVDLEQPVIMLESDKASMEVPANVAGVVAELKVSVGDKASEGTVIGVVTTDASATAVTAAPAASSPAPAATAPPPATPSTPPAPASSSSESDSCPMPPPPSIDNAAFTKAHASPAVRKFARELGVDLGRVTGSGRKGRVLKEDVQGFVKQTMQTALNASAERPAGQAASTGSGIPEIPAVDFSKFGDIETVPLQRIKKISGAALHRSWLNVPHVTQFDDADITELEAFRKSLADEAKKRDVKVTMLAFLLKASASALRQFPDFNASLDSAKENLILKKYCHIGVAVDTPNGLVVPVIRDVDKKGLFELAADLKQMSGKARDGKLSPTDMQGGCFTISSLGGIGGTAFTPIVNAPEVAILGVSRSTMKPVYRDGEFVARLILPLALSYDHRVIDGAAGARFTSYLSFLLSDIRTLLL